MRRLILECAPVRAPQLIDSVPPLPHATSALVTRHSGGPPSCCIVAQQLPARGIAAARRAQVHDSADAAAPHCRRGLCRAATRRVCACTAPWQRCGLGGGGGAWVDRWRRSSSAFRRVRYRQSGADPGMHIRRAGEDEAGVPNAEDPGRHLTGLSGLWSGAAARAEVVLVRGDRDCIWRLSSAHTEGGCGGAGLPQLCAQ